MQLECLMLDIVTKLRGRLSNTANQWSWTFC